MAEKGFGSLAEFASFLGGMAVHQEHAKHEAMDRAAKVIEDRAKEVLGTYDLGWPQLAQATQEERGRLGFPPNEPLKRTGEMRESISRTVHHGTLLGHIEAEVGSTSQIAVYQELGTGRIPPRPFLMGAAIDKEREVHHILGSGAVKGLITRS